MGMAAAQAAESEYNPSQERVYMRVLIAMIACVCLMAAAVVLAGEAEAPAEMVFEAKTGNVTFDHAGHAAKANDDCTVCHDKLFKKERGDLNFKKGMHKPAEKAKISCGACHHAGGEAFETKGNCKKCHVK